MLVSNSRALPATLGVCLLGAFATAQAALIANWKFDETSGQTAVDSAGSSNGQLGSTTNVEASDPAINQTGVFGTAYTFSETEFDRVDASAHVSTFASLGTGSVTGWFNMTSTGRGAFFNFGEASSTDRLILETSGSGNVRLVIREGNVNLTEIASTSTSFDDGNWHHFAVIQDGSGSNLYVDGVDISVNTAANSAAWFDDITSPSTFTFGFETRSGSTFELNGSLDDFAVFDHALSTTELNNVINFGAENYAIPEPSSFALLSLTGLALLRRRR